MKKFLEVLMDDEGQLHMSTDFDFADEIENPPKDRAAFLREMDQLFKTTTAGMVNAMWKERKLNVSKAVRLLSMAEVLSCADPYDNAEGLWSALMFDYIPNYEAYANKLKIPFGFRPERMQRPLIWDCKDGIVSRPNIGLPNIKN